MFLVKISLNYCIAEIDNYIYLSFISMVDITHH